MSQWIFDNGFGVLVGWLVEKSSIGGCIFAPVLEQNSLKSEVLYCPSPQHGDETDKWANASIRFHQKNV